jgi:eukaryotic-like serine/threonine-protein kinase
MMSLVLFNTAAAAPPGRIGKYDVLGELGSGGMAVVYRAHDRTLDRDVAVKVLHPHLARDAQCRGRFAREARAAARLRHPNIVEVYEFSDEADDQSYMVTELLEGPTLRRFAESHPATCAEVAAAIGVVLCDALAHAHKQGVIHRDVKPDNLMLQTGGVLKLTDFGIAHVADQREMTATGQVLGSPAHMAPEQIEGTAVDARTDLFAAGTVLYFLATARLPFDGPNAHALLRKILEGDYPDPQRVAPKVGHRFAAILKRSLERDPAMRYPDAAAMRADLMSFLADVGWTLPDKELQRYFADPEGTLDALRETLRERLPALGEAARRSGDIPGAMGYFNRALAYDPSDMRVVALVRGIARRRQQERTLKSVGIIAGAAGLTSLAVVAALSFRRPPPAVRPESHASAPPATPAPATPATPSPAPSAPAVPDAGPREFVVAPVAPDAGHRAVLTASSRRTTTAHPRASHASPNAPVAMQAIEVTFPGCVNVEYSLSTEGQTRRWASGQRINVPVGPAVIRARSLFGDCQSRDQAVTIEATSGVQRLRVPLRRVTPESSTASVRDASLSYN